MSDRPWLEDVDPALRSERALLKRLNAQEPPPGSIDQGWAALAAQIAVPPPAPAPLVPVAKAATVGLVGKVVAGVALTGALVWSGARLLEPPSPSATITQRATPPRVEAPLVDASPRPPVAEIPLETALPTAPADSGAARKNASATTLAEEGRLLAKAHHLVQTGQGQQALETLRGLASRYPRSVLFQEREVLTIEALGATGAAVAAKQRAERFLKRYPDSPHASRLQRFVD